MRVFIDALLEAARATGVVKTMFGRRRLVPELTSQNAQIRAAAERATVNLPDPGHCRRHPQARDDRRAPRAGRVGVKRAAGARMILTVHDELLFECPVAEVDEVVPIIRDGMEHAVTLTVPLTVDIGVGDNWKTANRGNGGADCHRGERSAGVPSANRESLSEADVTRQPATSSRDPAMTTWCRSERWPAVCRRA